MSVIQLNDCAVDLTQHRIVRDQDVVELTALECELLEYLLQHSGRSIPTDELLQNASGYEVSATVRETVLRLREKIEANPESPEHLVTVQDVGFRFELASRPPEITDLSAELTTSYDLVSPRRLAQQVSCPLPTHIDQFFGRLDESKSVLNQFVKGDRCVTLTGPPGVGKSRVAQEVGRMMGDNPLRVRPVRYVDASAAGCVEALQYRICQVLPSNVVPTDSNSAPVERVVRPMLLLIDNLEMYADSLKPVIQQCLRNNPELWMLLTSRQPTHTSGERVIELHPLALPPKEWTVTDLMLSPAIAFFVHAIRRRGSPFTITHENAEDVVALVKSLDGLPLGLHLAAARVQVLSPASLRRRLDQRFRWLRASAPGGTGREQSMEQSLERSWTALTELERDVFIQCSVFEGSFSLTDAETIVHIQNESSAIWILDALESLTSKSLITTRREGNTTQFRLLYTLRLFVRNKYPQQDEQRIESLQRRYVTHFCNRLEAAPATDWDAFLPTLNHAIRLQMGLETGMLALTMLEFSENKAVLKIIREKIRQIRFVPNVSSAILRRLNSFEIHPSDSPLTRNWA